MDVLLLGFIPLSLLFVIRAVAQYYRRIERVEGTPPPPSQSSSILSVLSDDRTTVHNRQTGHTLTEPPISEQLKIMIRTLVLDIAGNSGKRELVAGLRGDDAQRMVNYLDQLLSSESTLNDKQKKHLLNLLLRIAKPAQLFPVARELSGVVYDFARPHSQGVFSCIYKGTYEGQLVCVRVIRGCKHRDKAQDLSIQAQAKQLMLWSHLSHPNILPFQGVFLSAEDFPRICLVSRWMESGDLCRFLKQFPESPKLPLILEITDGLQYLHRYGVVHGELRAENIFVSDNKHAVIANIGFSNVAMTVATVNHEGGISSTVRWMAPELFEDQPRTTQSDVWSLGCLFYEILSGNVPFAEFNGRQLVQLVTAFAKGHITPLSNVSMEESERRGISCSMRAILENECWQRGPQQRSTAKKLHQAVARLGTVNFDDYPTADSDPQLLLNIRRSDLEIYHQLYRVVTRVIQAFAENTENSNESTSGSGDDTHRTSATSYMNDATPMLNASLLVPYRSPISTTSKSPSIGQMVHSPVTSTQELETLFSTHNNLPINRARTLSGPVPDEHSDQFTPPSENSGSLHPCVDLAGFVKREETLSPVHRGGYSDIYSGFLTEPLFERVSIKVFRINEDDDKRKNIDRIRRYILGVAGVWRKLRHANVLPFYGIATDLGWGDCPALITPYCDEGNAGSYIRRPDSTVQVRLSIMLDVSRGLQYLHDEGIVHGNLKPSNILIKNNHRAVVCDFGFFQIINEPGFSTKPAGTVRYQAPELLDGSATANRSTDICALGLTSFELWTKTAPYADIQQDNILHKCIIMKSIQQPRPNPAPPMADTLWPLLVSCFSHESEDRPEIETVIRQLEFLLL